MSRASSCPYAPLLFQFLIFFYRYHDWEHFSSVRNLTGPHTGLPNVVEKPPPKGYDDLPNPQSKRNAILNAATSKARESPVLAPIPSEPLVLSATPSASLSRSSSISELDVNHLLTPAHIPLPLSRSVSPPDSIALSPPASQISNLSSQVTHASAPLSRISPSLDEGRLTPTTITIGSILAATLSGHGHRSPKRTFDQSEEKGLSEPSVSTKADEPYTSSSSKRYKLRSSSNGKASHRHIAPTRPMEIELLSDTDDDDDDINNNNNSTPSLSPDNSSQEDNSPSSNSSGRPPSPVRVLRSTTTSREGKVPRRVPATQQKTPTLRHKRRAALSAMENMDQSCMSRKAKRAAVAHAQMVDSTVASTRILRSASKSVTSATPSGTSSANEEWQKNGYGRLDVRGFRELRI